MEKVVSENPQSQLVWHHCSPARVTRFDFQHSRSNYLEIFRGLMDGFLSSIPQRLGYVTWIFVALASQSSWVWMASQSSTRNGAGNQQCKYRVWKTLLPCFGYSSALSQTGELHTTSVHLRKRSKLCPWPLYLNQQPTRRHFLLVLHHVALCSKSVFRTYYL